MVKKKGFKKIEYEWEQLKQGYAYIKIAKPYLLSHHPHCKYYSKDVLKIGKYRFCWGCIVTYPTMVSSMILFLLLDFQNKFAWWEFVIAGIIFGSYEFISLWRKGSGLRHRIIKFLLGIGLALTTIGVFTIPIHLFFRILIFIQLYMMAGLLGSLRMVAMEKKCRKCKWKGNWYKCPGFEELNRELKKRNLIDK
ncbi:MAG: hypothetical protein JRJ70_17175 [Deltaproteobacteria bacterium]|nr:hypothetical protein [Deltaproteobacteria bacterium]